MAVASWFMYASRMVPYHSLPSSSMDSGSSRGLFVDVEVVGRQLAVVVEVVETVAGSTCRVGGMATVDTPWTLPF